MNATQMDNEPRETIAIEQCAQPRSVMQSEIMSLIGEYGYLTDEGSLDVSDVLPNIDTSRGNIEETFGKYGRVVRYATDVESPSIKSVRDPHGRGGDVQKNVFALIDDHATLNSDGTVDISSLAQHEGPDGQTYDSKVIARNIARTAQVQLPWDERPDHVREATEESAIPEQYNETMAVGGTFDDPVLNQLFSADDVPSDPIAAFRRGWDLRDRLEQNNGGKA